MADSNKKNDATATLSNEKKPVPPQLRPFQPGNTFGKGRPKGSRNKLSENFIAALSDDFDQHGVSVIEAVRAEKPADYLKIIAAIVPKELNIRDANLEDMSDEDLLENLERVRSLAASLVGAKASKGVGKARGKEKSQTSH